MSKKGRLRVRQTVSVPACASVLQSERGGVRIAEVETERENGEPETQRIV